jgi:formylglycine-generating enzyme required for sulfatase activity
MNRPLRVFLCHASQDKPAVRELYKRLSAEKWIDPWLDEEKLLPGQDFDLEIYKAARDSDAIIICLSKVSVAKEGYVNKEIRRALDAADEKPEGAIYIIPLRLDDCSPSFERLRKLHYADYFTPNAHEKLIKSLRLRAGSLKIETSESIAEPVSQPTLTISTQDLDLYRFVQIPATPEVPYSFYIGKYPVTNAQYERFLSAPDYSEAAIWRGFLKFNEDCIQIGRWHDEGWDWFQQQMTDPKKFLDKRRVIPGYWSDPDFGISNPENPVVCISWYEASAYCNWLMRHWNELIESKANTDLRPRLIRLPLETEWVAAAGGEIPKERYSWDVAGKATTDTKEIKKRANTSESNIGHTTPVNAYLLGLSPYGVVDMAGNVWEWQANYRNRSIKDVYLGARGGAWGSSADSARVSFRSRDLILPLNRYHDLGFRVTVFLPKV